MRIIGTITRLLKTEDGLVYCCITPQSVEPCVHKSLMISFDDDKLMASDVNDRMIEDEHFQFFAAMPCAAATLGDVVNIVAEAVEQFNDYFLMPNARICEVVHSKLYNHLNLKQYWNVIKESALR